MYDYDLLYYMPLGTYLFDMTMAIVLTYFFPWTYVNHLALVITDVSSGQ